TTATPYVINSTFSEAQDLEDVISINPSAGGNAITNLLNPTDPQDAATKDYVDGINVSAGDGITVTPSGQEFNVAVSNPIVALGKINSDGSSDSGKLIGALINYDPLSPGEYEVVFDSPRPIGDDNYIVQLTLINVPGPGFSIEVSGTSNTGFTVLTSQLSIVSGNLNSSPTDADWYFTVTNL
ncbi:hypothetical protein, partial [Flagellimonas abyssi]